MRTLRTTPVVELFRGGKALNSKLKFLRVGVALQGFEVSTSGLVSRLAAKYGKEVGADLEDIQALKNVLEDVDREDLDETLRETAEEFALKWQEAL